MFGNHLRNGDRRRRPPGRARDLKQRPSLEALEGRKLLSLGAELPGTVNSTVFLTQTAPDNATNSGGASVVVWETQVDITNTDIRAQRYNSFGGKVGPEFIVANTALSEIAPTVAIDDRGDFVVAWREVQGNGSSGILKAQRFGSNGAVVGSRITVASGDVSDPDVAMDGAGDFVISYTKVRNNNVDVQARRFKSSGQLLGVVTAGASPSAENHARVAMTPDGRFDIVWERAFSASDHNVFMSRFAANGKLLQTHTISTSPVNDETPSISVDDAGNGVVAWEQSGVLTAERFTSAGVLGAQILISSPLARSFTPSVALKRGGGGCVASYVTLGAQTTHTVVEVSAANMVTLFDAGRGSGPVSIDASGNYLMTFVGADEAAPGSVAFNFNIHARRGKLPS
jgi:hypothetical protein